MTDKIKLMSDEEVEEASERILTEETNSLWEEVESRLLGSLRSHEKLGDMWTNISRDQFIMLISIGASWARDECEKRAFEVFKELLDKACVKVFYENEGSPIVVSAMQVVEIQDLLFQQFLEEQESSEEKTS